MDLTVKEKEKYVLKLREEQVKLIETLLMNFSYLQEK